MKRPTEQEWWINAHEAPSWLFDLEQALVDAELCAWDARGKPHPQSYAMVAAHFFKNLASTRQGTP